MTKLDLTVNLTEAHLAAGEPGSATKGALALAVRERFPNAHVHARWLDIHGNLAVLHELSREAQAVIRRLDNGKPVRPREVRL